MERLVALLSWIVLVHIGVSRGAGKLSSPLPYLVEVGSAAKDQCVGVFINENTVISSKKCQGVAGTPVDLWMPDKDVQNVPVKAELVNDIVIYTLTEGTKDVSCFADYRSNDEADGSECYMYYSAVGSFVMEKEPVKLSDGWDCPAFAAAATVPTYATYKALLICVNSTEEIKAKAGFGTTLICDHKVIGVEYNDLSAAWSKSLVAEEKIIMPFLHLGKASIQTTLAAKLNVSDNICQGSVGGVGNALDEIFNSSVPFIVKLLANGKMCMGLSFNENTILTSIECKADNGTTIDLWTANEIAKKVTVETVASFVSIVVLQFKEELKDVQCFVDYRLDDKIEDTECFIHYIPTPFNESKKDLVDFSNGTTCLKLEGSLGNIPDNICISVTEDIESKMGLGTTLICNGKSVGMEYTTLNKDFVKLGYPENKTVIAFFNFNSKQTKTFLEGHINISNNICPYAGTKSGSTSIDDNSNKMLFLMMSVIMILL